MKKLLLLLSFVALTATSLYAQNQVYWEDVHIVVEPGDAPIVLGLMDDFYSSIEIPEGTSVSLLGIFNKSEWTDATHVLSFIGSADGLSKLRDLRSGEAYNNYNNSITSVAKIVAIKQGNTLVRVPGENSEVWSSQEWSFYVDDAVTFGNAFAELMKNVEPSGYVSLGQYTAGERGETHYIYANYPDYVSQLKSNVDTPKEQEVFVKFLEKIGPISTYRGSVTLRPIKGWN
jgi:hypothetical protein